MCEGGLRAKFMQNISLQTLLLKTGKRVIAECCLDQVWGTGVPLYDEQALNQYNWIGQGILGKILGDMREEFTLQSEDNTTETPGDNTTPTTPRNPEMETNTEI